ncbi:MAG: hypothetical protein ACRBN8_41265 [Nannocystales bacterium]
MSDLLQGFWDVRLQGDVLIACRLEKHSGDMVDFLASFDGFYAALGGADASSFRLLIDLRASMGRNDPDFEDRLVERRRELFRRFGRTAVLVRSAVGRMQVQRHVDGDGFSGIVTVFLSEPDALAWLQTD